MRAICLQHVPFEGPGVFARLLEKRGIVLSSHLVPADGLPNHPGDLLIVMGGPMSVNDADPWIDQETAFVKRAIESAMPVLGICLGSQFMAKALGSTVGPGIALEVGMTPVRLTPQGAHDPVFGSMPQHFEVFEWHGEIFDLPPGAIPLATSDLCSVQAFRFGSRAYGLLFHLEMEKPGIEALCRACPADLARAKLAAPELLARTEPHLPHLHHWADRLLEYLLQSLR